MTLEEIQYAQQCFQGADFLTWAQCCISAKNMWRAAERNKQACDTTQKLLHLYESAGYAMEFLQRLWVVPQDWHKVGIVRPLGNHTVFSPSYAKSEREAFVIIEEYYKQKKQSYKDLGKRHFKVNRILRQEQTI
ncbi:MAG: hypothetical protein Q4C03_08180 [bacterium]|nr:hypothetical protein [bacterium]